MRYKYILLFIIVVSISIVPPFLNLVISIPSPFGFIPLNEKSTWINFYGTIIGGALTLLGVWMTISYTEKTRQKGEEKREKEQKQEFIKRDEEIKNNLSAQYKPILDITCHPDLIKDCEKFGLSKHKNIFVQNSISINKEKIPPKDSRRINIILTINNIGRGEAIDLVIQSDIFDSKNTKLTTVPILYKSLYISNGIDIMFYKILSDKEWDMYDDKILDIPFKMKVHITYKDLVNKEYKLETMIEIKRFIRLKDENDNKSEKVLIFNPYDTTILNEIK